MNKYPLIGGSICAVVLLVLASLMNVVGYQTVQVSNQKMINSEIDQKELLFQTIVDMANNKEIQKVILGSEITGKRFFNPGMRFSTFTFPVVTKRFLNFAYQMGLILSKTIWKSKIHSFLEKYPVRGLQKKINAVIKNDAKLNNEITQLSNSKCNCGNANTTTWDFPVICEILYILWGVLLDFTYFGLHFTILWNIVSSLFYYICWFGPYPPPFQYFV